MTENSQTPADDQHDATDSTSLEDLRADRWVLVLRDRSGSMYSAADDSDGGVHALLQKQREVPGRTLVTLAQFDSVYEVVYKNTPLEQVPFHRIDPRGSTALLDAVGRLIVGTTERFDGLPPDARPDQVILVISTDGAENSSKEYTLTSVKALITACRIRGWQVYFVGADQDAIRVGHSMGVAAAHSLSYDSRVGTRSAFTSTGEAIARGSVGGGYEYTNDERDEATGNSSA